MDSSQKHMKGPLRIENAEELEGIDVEDDIEEEKREMDVDDARVKDRWSRYIGAMGVEAVRRQAGARVFLSGLGALGVEIAKNLTLAGCRELTLHDSQ